ncbi:hypothetical protein Tco_0187757 [Tanacetum coccineum]
MELAMVKCLKSPEYQGILGHALGRAVDYGMQEGLAAGHEHGIGPHFPPSWHTILRLLRTIILTRALEEADEASTSMVISCVEDLDTDEDLGSVVCMPQLEDPRFEIFS